MEPYRQQLYQHYLAARAKGQALEEVDRLDLRAAHLQNLIPPHFPPDKRAAILDVGCGHGAMLYSSRQAGYHNGVGIDCSAVQVAHASRHAPRQFLSMAPVGLPHVRAHLLDRHHWPPRRQKALGPRPQPQG
jgi:2-polyprenyl-3-methyl-5-hydroxy-6-metoxy-1,4-benzoquinol methylase